MNNYLDNVNKKTKEYFKVLEPEFPEWLNEYINTPAMLKQQYISITCGTIYTDLFESSYFFSSLDHGVAVALVIWHFTHDKKQTLSGLFHDIATPVFKHCIDFLNGDYMQQESTEELTTKIIAESKEIMELLKRDNISLDEVDDYHKYPIADNATPKLSADRLEYSLSNGVLTYNLINLDDAKEIYNDIEIQTNEDGVIELGFKTKKFARQFVKLASDLSIIYRDDRTRYSMQFLADIMHGLNEENKITKEDLYNMKESEVIDIIESSKYKEVYKIWKDSKKIEVSDLEPKSVYYVHHGAKVRYINPLVKGKRIYDICKIAKNIIDKNLAFDMSGYVYITGISSIDLK